MDGEAGLWTTSGNIGPPPTNKGHGSGVDNNMKASGGFGTRWMTDLTNNIVKQACIPNDWRNSTPGAGVPGEMCFTYVRFIQSY